MYPPLQANVLVHKDTKQFSFAQYMKHSYETMSMYLGGPAAPQASRPSTCLVIIGFSFFALLMISAYTAQLATFLVSNSQAALDRVDTVPQAISRRYKICVHESHAEVLLQLHPTAQPLLIEADGWDTVMENFRVGECEAAVVVHSEMLKYNSHGMCMEPLPQARANAYQGTNMLNDSPNCW